MIAGCTVQLVSEVSFLKGYTMFTVLFVVAVVFVLAWVAAVVGPGLDRTGILTPRQTQGLVNPGSKFKDIIGGRNSTVTATTTADTLLFRSEFVSPDVLSLGFNFQLNLAGLIGSDGGDNVTLKLNAVKPDGTGFTLVTITTVSMPNEAAKPFMLSYLGRVVQEQVLLVPGKIAAVGIRESETATPQRFSGASALAGVEVDMGNGLHFEVTAAWSATGGNTAVSAIASLMLADNIPGG